LTEQLVAVDECTTHRGNCHTNPTRIEYETIFVNADLVGVNHRRGIFTISTALRRIRGNEGRLWRHTAKVTQRPNAILRGNVPDCLSGLSTMSPTTDQLHLLNQLVSVSAKERQIFRK
jgi:hypothetical protein